MTIFYDLIFVIQHYCIYRGSSEKEEFYRDDQKKQILDQEYKIIEEDPREEEDSGLQNSGVAASDTDSVVDPPRASSDNS